jgi:hypothetical protein
MFATLTMNNQPNKYFIKQLLLISMCTYISLSSCTSKKGCTDDAAINYEKSAKIENGTCKYASFALTPKLICALKSKFDECSGIEYQYETVSSGVTLGRYWIFNDGGNGNLLYTIDTTDGGEKENIELKGVLNTDWEDIAQDDQYMYVGDFGNNSGNRTDLRIQKINKPSLVGIKKSDNQSPETIFFSYPDQKDFRKNEVSDFDCEAMIATSTNLYIFTKDHTSLDTRVYKMSKVAGTNQATLIGVFKSDGLITGADISPDGTRLALIGFNIVSDKAFVWLMTDFTGDAFFTGKKFLIDIGYRSTIGQTEGVSFRNNENLVITNEQYKGINPSLYELNIASVR